MEAQRAHRIGRKMMGMRMRMMMMKVRGMSRVVVMHGIR